MKKKIASLAIVVVLLTTFFAPFTVQAATAGTPASANYLYLAPNNSGYTVAAAQYLLRYWGYSINVTSTMDTATVNAVKSFQKARGLVADGWIGPLTWAKLANVVQNRLSYSTNATKAIQYMLRYKFNFDMVSVNGVYDDATRTAVMIFQAWFRLEQDGCVGPITYKYLITFSTGNPNCFGFAIGTNAYSAPPSMDLAGMQAWASNSSLRIASIRSISSCQSALNSGEYRIAVRNVRTGQGGSTYIWHVARQMDNGWWCDKDTIHGNPRLLTKDYNPGNFVWPSYRGDSYYNGSITYYAVKLK